MKFGIRKPNLKKSLKARTTGKLKRSVKKALIPGYGKKGMGWIKKPKKAAYNKVYNKTSVSLFSAGTSSGKANRKVTTNTASGKKSPFQNIQFESQSYSHIEGETEAMKKRKTCLWVLGWIFIFPVTLTILMVRNRSLNRWLKIGIIAIAWIIFISVFASIFGDKSSNMPNSKKDVSQTVVSEETVPSNSLETSNKNKEKEETKQKIVDDEVVNAFLSKCEFDYGEIEKGNIRTKFFVRINGCRTELLNSNTNELIVTINGYHIDDINEAEVIEAFKMVVQTINGNQYDTELEKVITGLLEHNTDLYEGTVGNVDYKFSPFADLSRVFECWIEIKTKVYNIE